MNRIKTMDESILGQTGRTNFEVGTARRAVRGRLGEASLPSQ
jgi:hypothetical protein